MNEIEKMYENAGIKPTKNWQKGSKMRILFERIKITINWILAMLWVILLDVVTLVWGTFSDSIKEIYLRKHYSELFEKIEKESHEQKF